MSHSKFFWDDSCSTLCNLWFLKHFVEKKFEKFGKANMLFTFIHTYLSFFQNEMF